MESQHLSENEFKFHGKTGEYFGIWIVNVLLSIVTLGIYSAWAKVRNKQYFYGNSELAEERFEYLAKPLQILLGRIIAVVLVIIWAVSPMVSELLQVILMLAFVAIMPILVVKNLRFDSRVTRYRNVRFDFVGSYGGAYMALMVMPFIGMLIFAVLAGSSIAIGSVISPFASGVLGVVAFGIGGTYFTPIINAPEVAILGVSKNQVKPHWDGKQFVPRTFLPLSLSYDHRAVNGADAAKFTSYLGLVLGDIRRLIL